MREFVARQTQRCNRMDQELKSNVTENDNAQMAAAKGINRGSAVQAAVDGSV